MPRYRLKHPEDAKGLKDEVKAVQVILDRNILFSRFPAWLYGAINNGKVYIIPSNKTVNVKPVISAKSGKTARVGDFIIATHVSENTFERVLDVFPEDIFLSLYEKITDNDYSNEEWDWKI